MIEMCVVPCFVAVVLNSESECCKSFFHYYCNPNISGTTPLAVFTPVKEPPQGVVPEPSKVWFRRWRGPCNPTIDAAEAEPRRTCAARTRGALTPKERVSGPPFLSDARSPQGGLRREDAPAPLRSRRDGGKAAQAG